MLMYVMYWLYGAEIQKSDGVGTGLVVACPPYMYTGVTA